MKARASCALLTGFFLAALSFSATGAEQYKPALPGTAPGDTLPAPEEPQRNNIVLGCWGDADKGDSADLKLHFIGNGALVQYDENKTEKNKRTFGAWEMKPDSTYLVIYWPAGNVTSYTVKRIGPILHFSGMAGASNFTLREIPPENCWSPEI